MIIIFMSVQRKVHILSTLSDPPSKTIDEFSSDDFRQLFDLNLMSVFLCCKVRACYFAFLGYFTFCVLCSDFKIMNMP